MSYGRDVEDRRSFDEDLKLYDRLRVPPNDSNAHGSPAEHPCTPAEPDEMGETVYYEAEWETDGFLSNRVVYTYRYNRFPGNLLGWHQHRHLMELDLRRERHARAGSES